MKRSGATLAPTAQRTAWLVITVLVAALIISGCHLLPVRHRAGMVRLVLASGDPSLLVVLLARDSPQPLAQARLLVTGSARPGERVIITGSHGGTLVSSVAPRSPAAQLPGPPTPLPGGSTAFQRARHAQALRDYQHELDRSWEQLRKQQRQRLATWVGSLFIRLDATPVHPGTREVDLNAALASAAGDVASLQQTGLAYGGHEVIAVVAGGDIATQDPPSLPASLHGATVVVDDFPASGSKEARWQASLVEGGARWAVLLNPATDGQLARVVREGLDGAITDTLSSVLFQVGQYHLQASAQPRLLRLLHLLTVAYPHADASIGGYTDDLPAPGGNLLLSQRRAQAVQQWLIAHGVTPSRLEVAGYGHADPVAPNTPAGQPLNRRVIVVLDPVAGG